MAKLQDLAPAQKRVLIAEQDVDVRGLSLKDISQLLARYPELTSMMGSGMTPQAAIQAIMEIGPGAVAAVIAAGCGSANDDQAEAVVSELALGVQMEILAFIAEATLPTGARPFERLRKAMGLDLAMVQKAASSTIQPPTPSTS